MPEREFPSGESYDVNPLNGFDLITISKDDEIYIPLVDGTEGRTDTIAILNGKGWEYWDTKESTLIFVPQDGLHRRQTLSITYSDLGEVTDIKSGIITF